MDTNPIDTNTLDNNGIDNDVEPSLSEIMEEHMSSLTASPSLSSFQEELLRASLNTLEFEATSSELQTNSEQTEQVPESVIEPEATTTDSNSITPLPDSNNLVLDLEKNILDINNNMDVNMDIILDINKLNNSENNTVVEDNSTENTLITETNLSDLTPASNNFSELEEDSTTDEITNEQINDPAPNNTIAKLNEPDTENSIDDIDDIDNLANTVEPSTELKPINQNNQNNQNIIKKNITMPEVEIIENVLENAPENVAEKNQTQVTFSSSDLYEIKSIDDNSNGNLGNASSITSNSEYSYTNAIKTHKTPNTQQLTANKKLRMTKLKGKKKIVELDEVDYLYNKLQDYKRNMIVDRTNYVLIISKAMEIIENYSDGELTGTNKRDTVVKAINRLIMIDLDLSDFDQRLFLSSMSNVIELIISCTNTKPGNNDKKNFNNKNDNIDDIVLANCGQIIYSIIDKITTIVLKKQYTADKIFTNIATVTEILMILADKYSYLTGSEKKMIVLQAIDKFIKTKLEYVIELPKCKKDDLILALDSVPMIIDLFITIQKGKYKINKKQTLVVSNKGWFKLLCGSKAHNGLG